MKPCVGAEEWASASKFFTDINCDICNHFVNDKRTNKCAECIVGQRHLPYKNLINLLEVEV